MTKRTNPTKSIISRRSAIAGAAATSFSLCVAEAGPPDPIFAVLQSFELAQQGLLKAIKASADLPEEQWLAPAYVEAKSNLDEAHALFKMVQFDLLSTMPTTRAGLAALLVRLGQATHPRQPTITNDHIEPGLLADAMCWGGAPTREAASTVLSRIASLVITTA